MSVDVSSQPLCTILSMCSVYKAMISYLFVCYNLYQVLVYGYEAGLQSAV